MDWRVILGGGGGPEGELVFLYIMVTSTQAWNSTTDKLFSAIRIRKLVVNDFLFHL